MSADQEQPPGLWLRELISQSAERVPVHLSVDWSVEFPVEVFINGYPGYVSPRMLGVSEELTNDLKSFQQWWEEHSSTDDPDLFEGLGDEPADAPEWSDWFQIGRRLVERLQAELGSSCRVEWV